MPDKGKKLLTIVGILASLVVLAIIAIPTITLPIAQPSTDVTSDPEEEVTPDISDTELDDCSSWSDPVLLLIGNNTEGEEATDLIVGTFCNRPDLIQSVKLSSQPETSILAYACEAASGTIDDAVMEDDLEIYSDLYCSAAKNALKNETASLLALAQDAGNEPYNEAKLVDIRKTIVESETLIESNPYNAQQGFDKASSMLKELT